MAMKKWISLLLGALLLLGSANAALAQENDWIEVDYQTHFIKWDGVTTEEDFTDEAFDALTKTTVYQSDSSPTGYKVTFRFYGPEYETVEVAGEWYYSEPYYSSQNSAAKIHPNDWYNGCLIHTDDVNPVRPFDQMTLNEQKMLVSNGGWMTFSAKSVGKPAIVECDGPNGVNNIMASYNGTQLTGQSVLGYTWNKELAQHVGELFAQEATALKVGGLYAPGADTHRSPFGGRNYEYVSEDGLLTGEIVAAEVRGIQSQGVYCYVKHFALNDQETHRGDAGGLVTWANEQSMREIYLRPFELAVKDGGAMAMMSSYNRLGATPTAESHALLNQVLRNEWGFRGSVVTDCVLAADTVNINRGLRAGNDLYLAFLQDKMLTSDTLDTAAGHQALRNACHNILYTEANSSSTFTVGMFGQSPLITAVEVVLAAIIALLATYFVRRHMKMKRWRAQQ